MIWTLRIRDDCILVTTGSLLPIHAREASKVDLDLDPGLACLRPSSATALLLLWSSDGADDLGVAHLEVAGAVCCGLRTHLSLKAA